MCSETSPRISFSHDLGQADDDIVPVEQNESRRDTMLLESNSEFEFITSSCFEQESCSSADELFANGVILPFQVQDTRIVASSKQVQKCTCPPTVSSLPPLPHPRPSNENTKRETVKDQFMVVTYEEKTQAQSKSFWGGFKRSSSLNCDVNKSLIFSLPLLSRSNSTGSVSNNKRASFKDTSTKQKHPLTSNGYQSQQRPPLKKGHVGSYGNGVKISPVLNVPPPYISKGTASLFGLGSLLRSGRDKKNKK